MEYPKKLYKYRPWDNYSKDIILKNQLYLQSVEYFNDPFDGKVNFDLENITEDEWLNTILKVLETTKIQYSKKHLTLLMKDAYKTREESDISKNLLRDIKNRLGICCFTTSNNNLLMWAHYADFHRGICLEFDYSNKDNLPDIEKVIYSSKYPKANLFKDYDQRGEELRIACITKSKEWEYEQEYRMINSTKTKCNVPFEPQILTGVICGCKMLDKTDLIETLNKHRTPIVLYEAQEKEFEFGLSIKRIGEYGGKIK